VTTIVACATPPGRGGVGVIRVSGPLVQSIAKTVVGRLPKPRHATYCEFRDQSSSLIDSGLVLYFPAPHSFTGEDVLELQAHGGPVVIACLIEWLLSMGAVLAEPGEFSYRAFQQGKIDLVQAEAIADLIDASSRQAALSASRALKGEFSKAINTLDSQLISLMTYVEASIDFSDEPIDCLAHSKVLEKARLCLDDFDALLLKARQGALLRDGVQLVIAGPANAGKSSLMNALSQQEVAIVTEIPGTTRDVLRQSVILSGLEGLPVHCVDTAGLRVSDDVVEKIGIQKAWGEMAKADIVLLMVDATEAIESEVFTHWLSLCQKKLPDTVPIIFVVNKIDLLDKNNQPRLSQWRDYPCIYLSVKTQLGMDSLASAIKTVVGYQGEGGENDFIARTRHIQWLKEAKQHMQHGVSQLVASDCIELFAEDLRQAQAALGQIVGKLTSDDLLGHIFSTFCIGK